MLHGAVPVNVTDKFAEAPVQMVVLPLIVAVGRGLTLMVCVAVAVVVEHTPEPVTVKSKVTACPASKDDAV